MEGCESTTDNKRGFIHSIKALGMNIAGVFAAVFVVAAAGVGSHFSYEHFYLMPKARDAVTKNLRDPNSAQFRNQDFYRKAGRVCGEINSKNAYGAYVGFKRFISTSSGRYFIEGESPSSWDVRSELQQQIELLQEKNAALRKSLKGDESGMEAFKLRDVRIFNETWRDNCGPLTNG